MTGEKVAGSYISRDAAKRHELQALRKRMELQEKEMEEMETEVFRTTLENHPMDVDGPEFYHSSSEEMDGDDIGIESSPEDGRGNDEAVSKRNKSKKLKTASKRLSKLERRFHVKQDSFSERLPHIPVVLTTGGADDDTGHPRLDWSKNPELYSYKEALVSIDEGLKAIDCLGVTALIQRHELLKSEVASELRVIRDKLEAAMHDNTVERQTAGDLENVPKLVQPPAVLSLKAFTEPLLACLITVVVLNLVPGLSREGSNWTLLMLRTVVSAGCIAYIKATLPKAIASGLPTPEIALSLNDWPKDLRTAIEALKISPDTVRYACCSRCFSLYPPGKGGKYQLRCDFQAFPGQEPCDTNLVDPLKPKIPLKAFLYQPLEAWLARFLARPGIIDQMSNVDTAAWKKQLSKMTDIFSGSVWHNLKGPDGKPFFDYKSSIGELRLAFCLNVDWFSAFGRKVAGKVSSSGALYMVCMNLPPSVRYRVENVYLVGVMPGPFEPDYDEINHILRPLVNCLLRLWNPGVMISKTSIHDAGCLVRCILLALIADLGAVRKVAGNAAHGAKKFPCSFCQINRNEFSRTDVETFPRRTKEEHMQAALAHRDAKTAKNRADSVTQTGVRWSELLRLPYWDPTKFAVLDAMHNLLLNNYQNHCRRLLGMDASAFPPKNLEPHSKEQQAAEFQKLVAALKEALKKYGEKENKQQSEASASAGGGPTDRNKETEEDTIEKTAIAAMGRVRKSYVVALAEANLVEPLVVPGNKGKEKASKDKGSKQEYSKALLKWARANNVEGLQVPTAVEEPVYHFPTADVEKPPVLDGPTIEAIVEDMDRTWLPTWLQFPPRGVGTKAQGKLSADQWRVLCSVCMVFTLARLWGDAADEKQSLLENFLQLVIVVTHATKRSISEEDIHIIETNMQAYIDGAAILFGESILTINHHLTLHLPELLRLFGPVHGWWAFPFERYNGIIQRYKNNGKQSIVEETFMMSFCRAANLRALIMDPTTGGVMGSIRAAFDGIFGSEFRGTLATDLWALDPAGLKTSVPTWNANAGIQILPRDLYETLETQVLKELPTAKLSEEFQFQPHIDVSGFRYTPGFVRDTNAKGEEYLKFEPSGDSFVLVKMDGEERHAVIGAILLTSITLPDESSPRHDFHIMLYYMQDLSPDEQKGDVLRRFPNLHASQKWINTSESGWARPRDIVAHLAVCQLEVHDDGIKVMALSLNRN